MRSVLVYAIVFVTPWVLYLLWLRFLARKLDFILVLPLIACLVWLSLWPASYRPVWQEAVLRPDDSADAVVNGFIVLGLINSLIGCFPVILFHAIRSYLRWGAKRRQARSLAKQ